MKINVTKHDIEVGACKIPQRCMIAAAIKSQNKDVSYVSVRTNAITVTKQRRNGNRVRQHWAVPTKAAKAIIKFDAGEKVAPFVFETKLIDEIVITPVDRERCRANSERTNKARAVLAKKGKLQPGYGPRARVAGV